MRKIFDRPKVTYVVLVVAIVGLFALSGVGNSGTDAGSFYPCAGSEPNVLCVGATTSSDTIASFSNYSSTVVDPERTTR